MHEVKLENYIMFDIYCPIDKQFYLIKMSKEEFDKNKSRSGCHSAAIYVNFRCECNEEHIMRLY